MRLEILTWNSKNINDGSVYQAWIPEGQLANLSAEAVVVPRMLDFPQLSGSNLPPSTFSFYISILPGQTIATKRDEIKGWFSVIDTQPHALIAQDKNDSNRQWYLTGIPIRVAEESPGVMLVTLQLDAPVWKLVSATADTWNITATGQTKAVTARGNIPVHPVIAITPTSTKTGDFAYKRWCQIYNVLAVGISLPIDITNGGLNTSTIVGGGKMQADGDDVRVVIDGVEVDRWLQGMNSAATKIWVNLVLSRKWEAAIKASISNVGTVTSITFAKSTANLNFLKALNSAANKVLLIDSEAFVYDTVDLVNYTVKRSTDMRAQKGTAAASHAANATARWIEHDIWLMYGNSTIEAPSVDDTKKPMIDLTSTNTSWVYSNYMDASYSRLGEFTGTIIKTVSKLSYLFTADQDTFGDPSTKLGLTMNNYVVGSVWKAETAILAWTLFHPAGFTNVLYSGSKYAKYNSWPHFAGLQKSKDGTTWTNVLHEAIGTVGAWTAFGPRNQALSATFKYIRFVVNGSIAQLANNKAAIQFDTVTGTIDSAGVPSVTLNAEQNNYFIRARITNNTTGEYIDVYTVCELNKTVTIDCDRKLVYYTDGSNLYSALTLSPSRSTDEWLDLQSGSNTLQYDDTGIGNITVTITHRDRSL